MQAVWSARRELKPQQYVFVQVGPAQSRSKDLGTSPGLPLLPRVADHLATRLHYAQRPLVSFVLAQYHSSPRRAFEHHSLHLPTFCHEEPKLPSEQFVDVAKRPVWMLPSLAQPVVSPLDEFVKVSLAHAS